MHEIVQSEELGSHSRLVAKEVSLLFNVSYSRRLVVNAYHSFHEASKGPECHCIILHDCVERSKKVAHTLDVAQFGVIFVVCQEHVLHLLQVHVRPRVGERRIGVRMGNVFPSEQRYQTICTVDIFL